MKQKEFKNYANSFQAIARLGLESIERLLFYLDNPHEKLKFIHIAGTNGKGSVSAFLQTILSSSGLKCGKYISPNMISVCERISVDGEDITEKELNIILERVRTAALKTEADIAVYPTQFEIWTAAAFLYFMQKQCDVVVLETGLGGTRDATNIIPAPIISVIVHIAQDHTEYLGNTLREIAGEKAGIIKSGSECTVTAIQSPEAYAVLENVCRKKGVPLITAEKPRSLNWDENGEYFDYKHIKNIQCSMLGIHQLGNASVAAETAIQLGISEENIKLGIKNAVNMGRFEILSKEPLIVFDGAHNPDGMKTLVNSLNRYFPGKTKSFIMASMGDKDITGSLNELKKVLGLHEIYTVCVKNNPRTMPAEELSEIVRVKGFKAVECSDISEARSLCKNDMVVICGSLYLYKDYYDLFGGDNK